MWNGLRATVNSRVNGSGRSFRETNIKFFFRLASTQQKENLTSTMQTYLPHWYIHTYTLYISRNMFCSFSSPFFFIFLFFSFFDTNWTWYQSKKIDMTSCKSNYTNIYQNINMSIYSRSKQKYIYSIHYSIFVDRRAIGLPIVAWIIPSQNKVATMPTKFRPVNIINVARLSGLELSQIAERDVEN